MNIIFKYREVTITTLLGAYKKDPIYDFEDFKTLKNLLNKRRILKAPDELNILDRVISKWIDLHRDKFSGQSIAEIEENKFKKISSTFDLLYSMYHKVKEYLVTPEECSVWDYKYFTESIRFSSLASFISGELMEVDEEVKEELISFRLVEKAEGEYQVSDLGIWLYETCRSGITSN